MMEEGEDKIARRRAILPSQEQTLRSIVGRMARVATSQVHVIVRHQDIRTMQRSKTGRADPMPTAPDGVSWVAEKYVAHLN